MKTVIIYDTRFGNTKIVAEAIAKLLNADLFQASEIDGTKLAKYDTVIMGSPTHAWNMSLGMKTLFEKIKNKSFKGKNAAAFDTKVNSRLAGSAAGKIETKLKSLGFTIATKSTSFFVTGNEGPLVEGELEKAKTFAKLMN